MASMWTAPSAAAATRVCRSDERRHERKRHVPPHHRAAGRGGGRRACATRWHLCGRHLRPRRPLASADLMSAGMNESATFRHTTVLLDEAVEGVLARPDGIYVDGTFGRGGHSRLLLSKLAPEGRLIGIDRDPEAIAAAAAITDPRFSIVHSGFADMADQLADLGVH